MVPATNLHMVHLAEQIQDAIVPAQLEDWRKGDKPLDWANESLAITRRVYRELPASHEVGEIYCDRNIGTVEDRLAAAGVRLAALLNSLFDPAG